MKNRLSVQDPVPHLSVSALIVLAVAITNWPLWLKILLGIIVVAVALVAVDNRLFTTWIDLVIKTKRPTKMPEISSADLGCIALPGEDCAVRWEGDELVALIALHANPFTPTIVANGRTIHDDCVDSELVETLLARSGAEFSADIVSAGWRVARRSVTSVSGSYEQMIGKDPCPAFRRTWILVRVDPVTLPVSQTIWRGGGVVGAANALVAAATRLATGLSSAGVDARLARSFQMYVDLTGVGQIQQQWSTLRQPGSYTTVFSAPGGPDVWWAQPADRTVTRLRVRAGQQPRSVVALTTARPIERDPDGWVRLRGTQLDGLRGFTPVADTHHHLPVGSAGILMGQTIPTAAAPVPAPIYVPFDAAEAAVEVSSPMLLVQLAFRAAAAGASICLPPAYSAVAAALGGAVDSAYALLHWPDPAGKTWVVARAGVEQTVLWTDRRIVLPRGRGSMLGDDKLAFPIQPIDGQEEAVLGLRAGAQNGR